MIAYLRGFIAGLRGVSLWFCPYWMNIDEEETFAPTDPKADRWMNGCCRGWWQFRKRQFRKDDRTDVDDSNSF